MIRADTDEHDLLLIYYCSIIQCTGNCIKLISHTQTANNRTIFGNHAHSSILYFAHKYNFTTFILKSKNLQKYKKLSKLKLCYLFTLL